MNQSTEYLIGVSPTSSQNGDFGWPQGLGQVMWDVRIHTGDPEIV